MYLPTNKNTCNINTQKVFLIVIGFQYTGKVKDRPKLPGIVADIVKIKDLTKRINNLMFVTFTDIDIGYCTSVCGLDKALTHQFTDKENIVCKIRQYLGWLKPNKIIFYYTGHCENGLLLIPYNGKSYGELGMEKVKDTLCDNSPPGSNILIIMDCCNGHGAGIPYILRDSVFRRNIFPSRRTSHKIIYLCPTDRTDKSIATPNGSTFTSNLVDILPSTLSIKDISNKLKERGQKCVVYASHPDLMHIWSWVMGRHIDITIFRNTIVITRHN